MADGEPTFSYPGARRSPPAGSASLRFAAAIVVLWGAAAAPARAEELWTARSGQTFLHFNVDLLRDLGIDVEVTAAPVAHAEELLLEEPSWAFAILPGSDLEFRTEHDIVLPQGSTGGSIRLGGATAP